MHTGTGAQSHCPVWASQIMRQPKHLVRNCSWGTQFSRNFRTRSSAPGRCRPGIQRQPVASRPTRRSPARPTRHPRGHRAHPGARRRCVRHRRRRDRGRRRLQSPSRPRIKPAPRLQGRTRGGALSPPQQVPANETDFSAMQQPDATRRGSPVPGRGERRIHRARAHHRQDNGTATHLSESVRTKPKVGASRAIPA
jgi:hypothetical protein